jgi:hypothetical protein
MSRALATVWLQGLVVEDELGPLPDYADSSSTGRSAWLTMWLPTDIIDSDRDRYLGEDACSVLDLVEDLAYAEVLERMKARIGPKVSRVGWGNLQWARAQRESIGPNFLAVEGIGG